MSPWACVLGRRDDHGDWTFSMQENATVFYHDFTLNPVTSIQQGGFKSSTHAVARPLIYREVFPNGNDHVTVKAGLPSRL